jgi:predicted  nucleic acid-binding Zn-ribbon protein
MFRWFKHAKRLDDLEETVERLEKSLKNLEIEWSETYDKFRLLNMRVAKRVERLDKDSSQEEPQGVEGEETDAGVSPMFPTLSPRAREIQKQILARRNKGGE